MIKFLSGIFFCFLLAVNAYGADSSPAPRVSIFSTSTDWEAVTGLRLSEYRGTVIPDTRLVKRGLVLYYFGLASECFSCLLFQIHLSAL